MHAAKRPYRPLRRLEPVAAIVGATWLMLGLVGVACAQGVQALPSMAALRDVIGDASCDTDAQCATVAVGARACGGPEAYVAWSRRSTDPAAVVAAAARVTAEHRAAVKRSGMASICIFETDPGAQCVRPVSARSADSTTLGVCQLARFRAIVPR